MWVFTSKAFLSIVAPEVNDPAVIKAARDSVNEPKHIAEDHLLVRARRAGHIQAVFPNAVVLRVDHRDYRYRALVHRHNVADQFGAQAGAIKYTNFKDSIRDNDLHDAAARVWSVMHAYQGAERKVPRLDYPEHTGFTRAKGKPPVLKGNGNKGRR